MFVTFWHWVWHYGSNITQVHFRSLEVIVYSLVYFGKFLASYLKNLIDGAISQIEWFKWNGVNFYLTNFFIVPHYLLLKTKLCFYFLTNWQHHFCADFISSRSKYVCSIYRSLITNSNKINNRYNAGAKQNAQIPKLLKWSHQSLPDWCSMQWMVVVPPYCVVVPLHRSTNAFQRLQCRTHINKKKIYNNKWSGQISESGANGRTHSRTMSQFKSTHIKPFNGSFAAIEFLEGLFAVF